nr:MAG TPA: hypothetical protein [Caudoviricetes sp.]
MAAAPPKGARNSLPLIYPYLSLQSHLRPVMTGFVDW